MSFFQHLEKQSLEPLTPSDPRVKQSILSRSAIQIDWRVLQEMKRNGKGNLAVDAGDKGILVAEIGQVLDNAGGGYTLSGQIAGHPLGTFMATVHGDALVANIRTGDATPGDFVILTNPAGVHEIRELDLSVLPGCDGEPALRPGQARTGQPMAPPLEGSEGTITTASDNGSVIDLMVVYTSAASSARGGTNGMIASINQAVNEANSAFSGSGVSTSFRLVHSAQVTYSETSISSTDLERLTEKSDGYMDNVHSLRESYGADIVSLWTQSSYTGIAWTMRTLSNAFEDSAFNVCDVDVATTIFTMAHECGHNLGCTHDQANAENGPGLYSYSYGWRWTGTGGIQYRSIMAYDPGTRVLRFSNPSVSYNGGVTGSSSANNAGTINSSKLTASQWRTSSVVTTFAIDPESRSAPASAGSYTFNVTASGGWSWTLSGGAGWVTTSEAASQNGNQTFSYSLAANTGTSSRSATIHLTSGSLSKSHSITQFPVGPPLVTTNSVDSISEFGATVYGNVTSDGGSAVTERGVAYAVSTDPISSSATKKVATGTVGGYNCRIATLTPSTFYYVRAYATNSKGTNYGDLLSFTTPGPPVVLAYPVINIAGGSATGRMDVTYAGTYPLTECGLVYASYPDPSVDSGSKVVLGSASGYFAGQLTGLLPNRTYHVRAYAINQIGVFYSEPVTFGMPVGLPMVTTAPVTSIAQGAATAGGAIVNDGDGAISDSGVVYATHENPTLESGEPISSGLLRGEFSVKIAGLNSDVTYYVRAYATNGLGTSYGGQVSFSVSQDYYWSNLAGQPGSWSKNKEQDPSGVAVDAGGNLYVALPYRILKMTQSGAVTTLAGSNSSGFVDGTGSAAKFGNNLGAIALDNLGNVIVPDVQNHVIRKVTPDGVVTTLAGSPGASGSTNGTGTAARFKSPGGVVVDGVGNVYVADTENHTIRKITPAGVVTTFAGTAGSSGRIDGNGSAARFYRPRGVELDSGGNLYVADTSNQCIRKITPAGEVTILAGLGTAGSTDGTGRDALFNFPFGVTLAGGNLYVADSANSTLRKVTLAGVVTTFAGSAGITGDADGMGSAARFYIPMDLAADSSGQIFVADQYNDMIRKVTPSGLVTSIISKGEDGVGMAARFNQPSGVVVDADGNAFVADTFNHTIRKVTAAGVVTTLAGLAGTSGSADGTGSAARFLQPLSLALDGSGNVYVADSNYTIRKVTPAGVVTTLAGLAGSPGHVNGTGSAARFGTIYGMAVDDQGNLAISDLHNHTIRKVTPAGVVTTFVGGVQGSVDGLGTAARFRYPSGLAFDGGGNLYVADMSNHTIRKVTVAGQVTTLAGLAGTEGSADGTSSVARFTSPIGMAVDSSGHLFVTEYGHTIRKITPAGSVITIGGMPGVVGSADGLGSLARFNYPWAIAVSGNGHVLVADTYNQRISRGTPSASLPTVTTAAVSSITHGSSVAGGNVTTDVVGQVTQRGVVYSALQNPTLNSGIKQAAGSGTGAFTCPLSALDPGTTYYARAYAINGMGTAYGQQVSFSTPIQSASLPGVTTAVISSIGEFAALAGGSVTGGGSVSERGVVYSLYPGPQIGSALKVTAGSGHGDFTCAVNNLEPNTRYFVRAYATHATGTLYGKQVSFATRPYKVYLWTLYSGSRDQAGSRNKEEFDILPALFRYSRGVVQNADGELYVADSHNDSIRKIRPNSAVSIMAGVPAAFAPIPPGGFIQPPVRNNGTSNGTGQLARFHLPSGLALDVSGNLYIADSSNNAIRKMTPASVVSTFAGLAGYSGSGYVDGSASTARFKSPNDVTVDANGNVYVADSSNHRIRKITSGGVVTTLAGSTQGKLDGIGTAVRFNFPSGICVDASGTVYVADTSNNSIRKITPAGEVSTLADSTIGAPKDVVVDAAGCLYVVNTTTIYRIDPQGSVATIGGVAGSSGSVDGIGSAARFMLMESIAVARDGSLFVTIGATSSHDTAGAIVRGVPLDNLPALVTLPATGVSSQEAFVMGLVTSDNEMAITERGVVYSTSFSPTTSTGVKVLSGAGNGAFTAHLTGLMAGATYYVRAYAIGQGGTGYGPQISFTTQPTAATPPTVATSAVSNVTHQSASAGGNVTSAGGSAVTERGVVYATTQNPTTITSLKVQSGSGTGSFSSALIGLSANTTYYLRAYAINNGGVSYGSQISFITQVAPAGLPTVTTNAASNITQQTATAGGQVTGDSGSAVSERGVVFGTSQNPTTSSGSKVVSGSGIGSFTSALSGLSASTTYYVRSYAINIAGTAYGPQITFTTQAAPAGLPTVTTTAASNITYYTATVGGNVVSDGGSTVTVRGVVYSTSQNPSTTLGVNYVSGSGTGVFSVPLTGLYSNTTYYFRAYAANAVGYSYGPQGSFTTGSSPVISENYQWNNFAGLPQQVGSIDGVGTSARFYVPHAIVADRHGNLYVADTGNSTIRKITPFGVVTSLAGKTDVKPDGSNPAGGSSDGTGSAARFNRPMGLAVVANGNVYVADTVNHTIRKITPAGVVTTLAGKAKTSGSADGKGSAARFNYPSGIAVDVAGNLYVADRGNHTIRKVTPTGDVSTFAGMTGQPANVDGLGSSARLYSPASLVIDSQGALYVLSGDMLRKITAEGLVSTFAGSILGSADGTGVNAEFNSPQGVAVDEVGNVYVADTNNHTIRKVTQAGVVTTLGGLAGSQGTEEGIGSAARFIAPAGIAVWPGGRLFVTDGYGRVRSGTADGVSFLFTSPAQQEAPAEGGSYSFSVSSSGNWAWSEGEDTSWLTTSEQVNQSGGQTFSYNVALNTSVHARTASITLTNGFQTQTHQVTQAAGYFYFPVTLTREVPAEWEGTPDKVGQLVLNAVPTKSAIKLPSGTGFQVSAILPETLVKVTAIAKSGFLFSHWEGLPNNAVTVGHSLTFTMPEFDVANLRASFIKNPLSEMYGSRSTVFQGLLRPDSGASVGNSVLGMFTATLAPLKGSLSGKIFMDGKSTAFTAMLRGDGTVWFKSGKEEVSTFQFLGRELTLTWSENGLTLALLGTNDAVSAGFAQTVIPATPEMLDAKGKLGYYTLILPAKAQSPVLDSREYPQGTGYSTLTLSLNGTLKLAGVLADGTKITASSFLNAGGTCPVFIQLPTPGGKTKEGSLLGVLEFDSGQADTDVTAPGMMWIRPSVIQSKSIATQIYTAGWPQGLTLDAVGALYDGSQTIQATLGLDSTGPEGNASLAFSEGELTGPLGWNLNVDASKVVKLNAKDSSHTLSVIAKTGLMKGSFRPNWENPAKSLTVFQGVLLQKGASKGGYGYFLGNAVGDTDLESGKVKLDAP